MHLFSRSTSVWTENVQRISFQEHRQPVIKALVNSNQTGQALVLVRSPWRTKSQRSRRTCQKDKCLHLNAILLLRINIWQTQLEFTFVFSVQMRQKLYPQARKPDDSKPGKKQTLMITWPSPGVSALQHHVGTISQMEPNTDKSWRKTLENGAKIHLPATQHRDPHFQDNRQALEQIPERPRVAHPKPALEAIWKSMGRTENHRLLTLLIQSDSW